MTKELYKVYRPKTLAEVIGNEGTIQSLQNMLEKKKLPHTLLLYGPSGCGKTTIGRILRRELGCGLLDYQEKNVSDFRGIDTIRDIAQVMPMAPSSGKCRIFLLDECHQLTKDAQNAALKILEDTPSHVYFILCTTDPAKLIPTVRKRCMPLPVELLDNEQMLKLLRRVNKKAELDVSTDHLELIAENCEGSARQALVLLDKVSHLAGKARGKAIHERLDEERSEVIDLCRLLLKRGGWADVARLLRELKDVEEEKIRWAVMGYMNAILLSGKRMDQAAQVLQNFERPFYDSHRNGLTLACYTSIAVE